VEVHSFVTALSGDNRFGRRRLIKVKPGGASRRQIEMVETTTTSLLPTGVESFGGKEELI
jgi:hypothetical protein